MKKFFSLKIFYYIFLVFVGLSIIFMFLGAGNRDVDYSFDESTLISFNDSWAYERESGFYSHVDLPAKIDCYRGETLTLYKQLPSYLGSYNSFLIESKRQAISVYVNDEIRKSYSDNGQKISKSLPYSYVIVPLRDDDAGATLKIEITTESYTAGNVSGVFIGNEMSIILKLIRSNVVWFAFVVIILILGVVCLIGYYAYKKAFVASIQFLYGFWIALLSGIWCFSQLKIRQLFVADIPLLESFGYCCFLLIPIAIVLLANGATGHRFMKYFKYVGLVFIVNFLVQNILHTGFGIDYNIMQSATQLMILVFMLISVVVIYLDVKRVGRNFMNESCGLSLFVYILSIILEALFIGLNKEYSIGSFYLLGSYILVSTTIIATFLYNSKEQQKKVNAESENEAKSRFLATMSHEIRTPINVVLGMNEMILRESTEDHIRDYSSNIFEAGKSLLALVNDILDFSKIESGKMEIINVDYSMKTLLKDLIIMTTVRIGKKDLEFVLDIDENIPAKYFGDEVRLKQILTNLLTNSVKYTEKGKVIFTVKSQEITDNSINLYFSVKDTGIGIKGEDLAKLKDSAFVRFDGIRNKDIEGTGLGLSITRQLLTLMGSELKIDSKYGEGSDFSFVLPQKIVDKSPMGSVSEKVEIERTGSRNTFKAPYANILAVDDSKTNLLVVKGLLKPYGAKVTVASSGKECLQLCQDNQFDLIFLDHMMPEMDGIETLKNLRAGSSPNRFVKVVVLTANAVSGAEKKYMDSGFDGYLTKPIDPKELDACIKTYLPKNKIIPLQPANL